MSDVQTVASPPATGAPRHPAVLIVASTLAFVGAALSVGALFPDYWDTPALALVDQTGGLAQTLVFAVALAVGGALMLGARSAPIGAAMLVVVVAVALESRVVDLVRLSERDGPKAGTGFALVTAGFVLAVAAAALGAIVALRPRAWAFRGGARPLAALAALAGFAAAVGYGMNPYELQARRFSVAFGSPLAPVPRQLWAALLVVVVLTVVPPIAVAVGGRLGTGLALGLAFGVGGIAALRLGTIYGTIDGRDTGTSGAEGTWTFLAASGAALVLTFAGLAVGAGRGGRAADAVTDTVTDTVTDAVTESPTGVEPMPPAPGPTNVSPGESPDPQV